MAEQRRNEPGVGETAETQGFQATTNAKDKAVPSLSRRKFLARMGGVAAATFAVDTAGLSLLKGKNSGTAEANEVGPVKPEERREQAFTIRQNAAKFQRSMPLPDHPTNGDEERFENKIANYSKALPHNDLGQVDLPAYNALIAALSSGDPAAFEAIPQGGSIKQANPQAAFAFVLEGADSYHLSVPAPPTFSGAEEAGEMAELYWQALTRDVPFNNYASDPLTTAAAVDLSKFSVFKGPKVDGAVTPGTLFRGNTPGDLTGPYLSQFLWKPIPYGARTVFSPQRQGPIDASLRDTFFIGGPEKTIMQQYWVPVAGSDFMTTYADWLNIQKGAPPVTSITLDRALRYIRNGRDLAEYVHLDFSYQAFLNACLILLGLGTAALDDANPYKTSAKQGGFVTFGGPHALELVARVTNAGLRAVWCQKWMVHRRLRPEAFAGHLHNHKTGAVTYPIHTNILDSAVLTQVFNKYGTYLLPQAYPEGSPTHPSYPAAHAVIAGACVTVLKAFFKESFVIPTPVVVNADGTLLDPYNGDLTVGGELNKLAANIAIARDVAGVHWRSDGIEGLKLGEAVAISVLTDFAGTYNEKFNGFSLTKFDGSVVTVG